MYMENRTTVCSSSGVPIKVKLHHTVKIKVPHNNLTRVAGYKWRLMFL